uniref:Uncharacterized protein n=1 Tax=Daphnia galeata TaxID=27404 RepID=A0A8J2RPY8_9CRUS|nr:unnamed protein product [Daphnia galeata]
MAGKHSYEVFYSHLAGVILCLSTVKSKLYQYDGSVPQDVINVKYLRIFLFQTIFYTSLLHKCSAKRIYDTASNLGMGVSLPMEANGLRNHKLALVTHVNSIVEVFERFLRAALMLIVMAQPQVDGIPPIRILSFCTDKKFTA